MKRSTKNLADVDLRGRVRRVEKEPVKLTKLTLVGGPFGSGWLDIDLEVKNDMVQYGFWLWSWAGKKTEKGRRIYAKMPTERKVWKFMMFDIGHSGKDPRIQERMRPVRTDRGLARRAGLPNPKTGQGAIRRANKRAAARA